MKSDAYEVEIDLVFKVTAKDKLAAERLGMKVAESLQLPILETEGVLDEEIQIGAVGAEKCSDVESDFVPA